MMAKVRILFISFHSFDYFAEVTPQLHKIFRKVHIQSMFKNSFTICVDMDDTIENLLQAWVNWLNSAHNLNVSVEDCRSWHMSEHYPMLTEEQILEPLSNEKFWSTVQPKPDAQYYLNKLVEEHQEIYICTASHYDTVGYKMKAIIEKFFPAIDWKHIIVASTKQMLICDVMVDDGPHNLIGGNYHRLLFDANHNQTFNADQHGMFRVTNWEQVYQFLKHLDYTYWHYNVPTVKY